LQAPCREQVFEGQIGAFAEGSWASGYEVDPMARTPGHSVGGRQPRPPRRRLSPDFENLTREIGVYAICDLDNVPIYVGQTVSTGERGIIGRVRRHLTSARSDIIANRQLDVWELAFVRAWPIEDSGEVEEMERIVYHAYHATILAGKVKPRPSGRRALPQFQGVRILEPEEVDRRKDPALRFPRQVRHVDQLLDVIINVKDTLDQRRSLEAHIRRLQLRFQEFISAAPPEPDEGGGTA